MNGHHENNHHSSNIHSSGKEVESQAERGPRVDHKDDEHLKLDHIKDLAVGQRIPVLLASIKAIERDDYTGVVDSSAEQSEKFVSLNRRITHLRAALGKSEDAKDVFRQADGFESLLAALTLFSHLFSQSFPATLSREIQPEQQQPSSLCHKIDAFVDFTFNVIAALNEAIRQHQGNRKYFSKRIFVGGASSSYDGADYVNGWDCLRRAVICFRSPNVQSEHAARLSDGLLSLAIGQNCENGLEKNFDVLNRTIKIDGRHWTNEQLSILKQHIRHSFLWTRAYQKSRRAVGDTTLILV